MEGQFQLGIMEQAQCTVLISILFPISKSFTWSYTEVDLRVMGNDGSSPQVT